MTLILKFHQWNDIIASCIGIASNLFLIYLIFTVNKLHFKQYSQTLLQNCILDLILAILTLISQPQLVVVNGIYYNIVGSQISSLGYTFSTTLIAIYGTSITISLQAMAIPFYIRYLVLCKNKKITKMMICKMYIVLWISTVILLVTCLWCCWPFPGTYEMYSPAIQTKFWLDEYIDGPKFCAIHPGNIRLIVVFSTMFLSEIISYFLIILFSIKIIHFLQRSQIHMSAKTKQLNKQLLKTLAVQAIAPLFTGNFPSCCVIVMIFLQYENNYVTLGLSCLLGWVAVINPLAAIIIITPYRNRVKEILRIKNNQVISTSEKMDSVNHIQISVTNT